MSAWASGHLGSMASLPGYSMTSQEEVCCYGKGPGWAAVGGQWRGSSEEAPVSPWAMTPRESEGVPHVHVGSALGLPWAAAGVRRCFCNRPAKLPGCQGVKRGGTCEPTGQDLSRVCGRIPHCSRPSLGVATYFQGHRCNPDYPLGVAPMRSGQAAWGRRWQVFFLLALWCGDPVLASQPEGRLGVGRHPDPTPSTTHRHVACLPAIAHRGRGLQA